MGEYLIRMSGSSWISAV